MFPTHTIITVVYLPVLLAKLNWRSSSSRRQLPFETTLVGDSAALMACEDGGQMDTLTCQLSQMVGNGACQSVVEEDSKKGEENESHVAT